jgi:hypothetical protein
METILLLVTIASVATAIVALTAVRRVQRAERDRADARVAALTAAADTHGPGDGTWMPVAGEWRWNPEPAGASGPEIRPSRVTDRIPSPESRIPTSSENFFGTVQRGESAAGRLPLFAAAALIILLGGALAFLNTSTSSEHTGTVAQVAHTEPLELVSLGHARDVSLLTITGTVRNPSSGTKREGLTAVVSLLDNQGGLISTKDVPLDYRALGPGEEAPFKVSVPDPGAIARYRVSFRAGDDVVPHVDRRSDTKLASARQ